MQLKKIIWAASALSLTAALASCNIGKAPEPTPDVNAIFTSAAGTMVAQLNDQQTQTALAVPPTDITSPTPLDTFTPQATFAPGVTPFGTIFVFNTPAAGVTPLAALPTAAPAGSGSTSFAVGCNNAEFIGETVPDGTMVKPGKRFDKAWSLLNTGTCTWDAGYGFYFKSGDQMQGQNVVLDNQSPKTDFTPPGHSQAFVIHMWAPGTAGEYKATWQMKGDDGKWFGSLVSIDIIVHR